RATAEEQRHEPAGFAPVVQAASWPAVGGPRGRSSGCGERTHQLRHFSEFDVQVPGRDLPPVSEAAGAPTTVRSGTSLECRPATGRTGGRPLMSLALGDSFVRVLDGIVEGLLRVLLAHDGL